MAEYIVNEINSTVQRPDYSASQTPGLETPLPETQARVAESGNSPPKSAPPESNPASQTQGRTPSDVRIKFQIDAQTDAVTILILDRANQRVLRTIPPEEFAKLGEGDLLELFI